MAKNDKFIVPFEERKEFDLLVQRANRRIQANLKYIQQEGVKRGSALRQALLHDYASKKNWATKNTVFSRSKSFASQKDYEQFKRHVSNWGSKDSPTHTVKAVHEGYYKNIIKALTTTAQEHSDGTPIFTEEGNLPGGIAERIKNLTPEQIVNWFEIADPSEDIEHASWSYEEFLEGVNQEKFVDIVLTRLNYLEQIIPRQKAKSKAKSRKKTTKRRKKSKSKSRKKK